MLIQIDLSDAILYTQVKFRSLWCYTIHTGKISNAFIEGGKVVSTYSVIACFLLFVHCSWEKLFHVHCSRCIPRTLFLKFIIPRSLFFKTFIACTLFSPNPYLAFSSFISHKKIDISYMTRITMMVHDMLSLQPLYSV